MVHFELSGFKPADLKRPGVVFLEPISSCHVIPPGSIKPSGEFIFMAVR